MRDRFFASSILSVAVVSMGLAAGSNAAAQTQTWTVNADFDSGTSNNVQHKPADTVVLGPTPVSKTRLVWADNYNYGYVVRIDSTTGKQTSRFDSALVNINGVPTGAQPAQTFCNWANAGNCPGRITTDANGDVWIINRAFGKQGTMSKFSGDIKHCIDRNGDGVIETSFDKNNDGLIDVNPIAGEYFGQNDECIITTIPVGAPGDLPRAVAVDKRGKIWACTFNAGNCYRYNPNDPVVLEKAIYVGGHPYSAATGGDYLFVSNNGGAGGTIRVNITTYQVDHAPCPSTYGIVGDPSGNAAYLGGWDYSYHVYKADFVNQTCTGWKDSSLLNTAVTLDLAGNVWASGYSNKTISKFSPAGTLLGTYPAQGPNPHGLSVDFDGYIWAISDGQWCLSKYDSNGGLLGTFEIGGPNVPDRTPYIYSDFTGVQIDRQAPYTYVGSWEGTYDGGVPGVAWSKVKWNTEPQGAVPPETKLTLSVRAGDSMGALGQAAYAVVQNGAALSGVRGQYVEVRADLNGPGFATAVLSDVSVTGPCDPLSQACCVKDADCNDGSVCTLDTCPVPGGACVHAAVPECCMTDADCNDQNLCTTDTCPSPGGQCQHVALANCCMSSKDCSDGDACTADVCPNPGGQCSFVPINGCCTQDVDCTKGDKCSAATCVGGFCQDAKKPNCCATDADCADKDLCTLDTCDVANGTCSHAVQQGCCNVDGQCDDQNACTHDQCSGPGGVCVHSAIAGCCTPQDPQNGQPCDPPVSPNDHPPCKAGKLACVNGAFVCQGAVKPTIEVCNNKDDDCDGLVDNNSCPEGLVCTEGVCAKPCQGETPCPGGFQCYQGYCVPTDCSKVTCKDGEVCANGICMTGDGGVGGGVPTGTGGGATTGTGSTTSSGAGGGATTSGAGGAGGAAPTSAGGAAQAKDVWGLATGGACKCAVPGAGGAGTERAGLVLAGLALALSAARRRARRGPAERNGRRSGPHPSAALGRGSR
jgi:streptogramin lyase